MHTKSLLLLARNELRAVVAAVLGGARYGVKVRLPHSFVMIFLFKGNLSLKDKLRKILKLVFEHARNLAAFAAIYKIVLGLMKLASQHLRVLDEGRPISSIQNSRSLNLKKGPLSKELQAISQTVAPPGHPDKFQHAFAAGAVSGYMVWGRYSSLNYQILLYLSSRVVAGLGKRILQKQGRETHPKLYSILAALVWGTVMVLFEESPDVLHPSLKHSMDEIYRFGLE